MELDDLRSRDEADFEPLYAITYVETDPTGTSTNPRPFICSDGKTYWLKGEAQQGLVAELIAGRLAAQLDVGPVAAIVRVPSAALPEDGSADRVKGVVVGIKDEPNCENARNLGALLGTQFDPAQIDQASRGHTVVFQTWLGVSDSQVLVSLGTGRVFSFDHGDVFGTLDPPQDPSLIVTDIPGVDAQVGRSREHVEEMVSRVESLLDSELLEAVARVPDGAAWNSGLDRRLQIARFLRHRRDRIRVVTEQWLKT